MTKKEEVIAYCLKLADVYEDYPFHDQNWCVMRHKKIRKYLHGFFIKMAMSG